MSAVREAIPAHALNEVQRQPLPDQDTLSSACNPEDALAGRHGIAIGSEQFTGQRSVDHPKDKLGHLQTGDYAVFFAIMNPSCNRPSGNEDSDVQSPFPGLLPRRSGSSRSIDCETMRRR